MFEKNSQSFYSLAKRVARWRESGHRIVLCHGCFDPLHIGHLFHFRAAKAYGDLLVVTITEDEFVDKGPGRPIFTADHRLEMVSALRIVDATAINLWPSAVNTIKELRPHYFAKGAEYRDLAHVNPNFNLEKEAIGEVGGTMIYTSEFSYSATKVIDRLAFNAL